MPQPPRFGIVRNQNLPWQTMVRHWQAFEELGFDSIWHADHYQRPSMPERPSWRGGRCSAALAVQTEQTAHRHPGQQQHLPPPATARQAGGDGRSHLGWPARAGHRHRLVQGRARAVRRALPGDRRSWSGASRRRSC